MTKKPLQKHYKLAGLLKVKIKSISDLEYDKLTDKMFGFVYLDKVGIDLFDVQEVPNDETVLAKYVLVVMVR